MDRKASPLRLASTLCAGLALGMTLACQGPDGAAPAGPSNGAAAPAGRPRNVILISIDTLRADHLPAYGYSLPTSPNFDALAKRSVVFTNCSAASSHTLASHKSLLTGMSASSILKSFSDSGGPPRPAETALAYYQMAFAVWGFPSLGGRLKEAGLKTVAFTDGGYMAPRWGWKEGFDGLASGRRIGFEGHRKDTERLLEEEGDKPIFIFLHCYDVHCPYTPPKRFLEKFEAACEGPLEFDDKCGKQYFNHLTLSQEDKIHIRRHYDAAILSADYQLGELVRFLEKTGRLANTILIVTSDHGESLGEREFVGHGQLYENQLHVPLLVYVPGVPPAVVTAPVSGIDVAPTVLDYIAGKVPEGLDGWSLRPLMEAGRAGEGSHKASDFAARPVSSAVAINEGREERTSVQKLAVRAASPWKLIVDLETGKGELYDLAADPAEDKNLFGTGHAEEARLLDLAKKLHPGTLKGAPQGGTAPRPDGELPPEDREQLKSLGYVN